MDGAVERADRLLRRPGLDQVVAVNASKVVLMADASHHDQRGAVAEVGREARQLDPARQQFALLPHVLDRVVGEALERLSDLPPPGLGLGAHARGMEHLAARQHLAPAQHFPPARGRVRASCQHDQRIPVGQQLKQRVLRQVEEQHACLDQQLRSEVGIGPTRGWAAVEHRGRSGGDQLLGGHPIDVQMVDKRDLTTLEVFDEQLRPAPGSHAAADRAHRHWRLGRKQRISHRRRARRARSCCGHRIRG